ncbi:hypothetical protein AAHA92_18521 [Salvia divinorum]|uniref:Uncharacterized protein n=1 Tax=Salvia divinorum TaxID=28513 RepID=A0ABD1H2V3_SALDI
MRNPDASGSANPDASATPGTQGSATPDWSVTDLRHQHSKRWKADYHRAADGRGKNPSRFSDLTLAGRVIHLDREVNDGFKVQKDYIDVVSVKVLISLKRNIDDSLHLKIASKYY